MNSTDNQEDFFEAFSVADTTRIELETCSWELFGTPEEFQELRDALNEIDFREVVEQPESTED